jgi:hypothetical protein
VSDKPFERANGKRRAVPNEIARCAPRRASVFAVGANDTCSIGSEEWDLSNLACWGSNDSGHANAEEPSTLEAAYVWWETY